MMNVPDTDVKFDLKVAKVTDNKGTSYPVFEAKVSKDIVLADQNEDLLLQEKQINSVDGVRGAYISVGALDKVSTSGNWSKVYDSIKNNNYITNQSQKTVRSNNIDRAFFFSFYSKRNPVFFTEKKYTHTHTPEELLIELTGILSSTKELQPNFEHVTLIYTTNNYTLVPQILFDENKASEYLKLNTKILSNDYISHDSIDGQNTVIVYVPFMNINNYIFERYGSFQYYHSSGILIKNILNIEKFTISPKVYIHSIKGQFECIIVKDGKLQLCNSYPYKTPEDFIYYILFCFEQLQLNPDKVETFLCGDITKNSPLYKILYTYIRNVSFYEKKLPSINTEENQEHFLLKVSL